MLRNFFSAISHFFKEMRDSSGNHCSRYIDFADKGHNLPHCFTCKNLACMMGKK